MMAGVRISVVMAVYNGEKYLAEAARSILDQSFRDFELIIVNDGSTDGSREVALALADARVRLIDNPGNRGLPYSLNNGFAQAQGEYIARMDADDIAMPHRLAAQLAFMDANPRVGICGGAIRRFGAGKGVWRPPTDDSRLKARLFWDCPFAHPTVILRRKFWTDNSLAYDVKAGGGADYRFWVSCAGLTELANLPSILLNYRLHSAQIGSVGAKVQEEDATFARLDALRRYLGIEADAEQQRLHQLLCTAGRDATPEDLRKVAGWVARLGEAASRTSFCRPEHLLAGLAKRWVRLCRRSLRGGECWRVFRMGGAGCAGAKLSSLARLFLRRFF